MNPPSVSLVIPVCNEAATLHLLLDSLRAQDYEHILEIIFADGISTDGTLAMLEDFARSRARVVVLNNPRRIQTVGLNLAIRRAKGEIIIRLDAHAAYAPDYVRICVQTLQETGAACVGGGVNLLPGRGFWSTLFGMVQEHPFGTGVAHFRRVSYTGPVDTVWPGAYRREVFEQIGLFREHLYRTEDLDLHARLRRSGLQIWQTPAIRPYYIPRSTWKDLIRQYFHNGEQVIETFLINSQAIHARHLVPFGWIISLLVLITLALTLPWGWLPLAACAGLYSLTCVVSAAFIALKKGWRYFWLAPLVFLAIHLSYGVGSCQGLVRFILIGRKWKEEYLSVPRL